MAVDAKKYTNMKEEDIDYMAEMKQRMTRQSKSFVVPRNLASTMTT